MSDLTPLPIEKYKKTILKIWGLLALSYLFIFLQLLGHIGGTSVRPILDFGFPLVISLFFFVLVIFLIIKNNLFPSLKSNASYGDFMILGAIMFYLLILFLG
jgi:hypothetical protein